MRNFLYIFIAFLISACSLKPNLVIPEANYTAKDDNINISKEWWKGFNDDNLNYLVDEALKNNTDLKIAYVNLEQAMQTLGINRSNLLPKLDASASASRALTSINAPSNRTGARSYGNDFKVGLNLSYEVDLWGKYRDNYNAASAALKASEFDYSAARLSLISNVVQTYFNTANAYEQMLIYKESLDSYIQTYELEKSLYEAGAIGEYELNQAKAELESVKTQYNSAVSTKETNLKALKILVSSNFDDIMYQEQNYTKFTQYALELPQGISSTILLQRPDIQSAIKSLEQKNYLVGVARADFLPSLSLTGLLGFESADLGTLVKEGSKTWSVGGSFLMPIFHWGEIKDNVNLAKLSKDQAFLNYEKILKTAFSEIQLALINRELNYQNYQNYTALLEAQKKVYEFANMRYQTGSISFKDYLDAKRNFLNAEISYVNANYAMANSIVGVIKAFGGGFKTSDKLDEEVMEQSKQLDMSFRE